MLVLPSHARLAPLAASVALLMVAVLELPGAAPAAEKILGGKRLLN